MIRSEKDMNRKTYHSSGALVKHVVATASHTHSSLKEALLHLHPVVVEVHGCGFFNMNIGKAAESDDVVAAGDGGEDACLDVHRSVSTSRAVR